MGKHRHPFVQLEFRRELSTSDAEKHGLLVIGSKKHMSSLKYEDIKIKFGTLVSEEQYNKGSSLLCSGSSSDTIPLHMKYVTLARLPSTCSRHNTPSQAHAITKLVKNHTPCNSGFVVIVCEEQHVFASACAVARAFPLYSRKSDRKHYPITVEFILVSPDEKPRSLSESDISCITAAAEGIRLAAKIVDMPCLELHTDAFVEEVEKVGATLGVKTEIIRGEELDKRGMGGIYAVGKAAAHPPALAVLSHTPEGATQTIAWVGKGIVYDTGGLSIKSRTSMCGMKRDCGGAAAVLGAFSLAVKMGFKENLHAVFCLAENSIGPDAIRPDDIITMYSGKTVEINNTDAEGRLVLGDGVAYAKKDLHAETIVDIATLTGAQGTTTGKQHGGVLSNSEEWEKLAVDAGKMCGDLLFPLVYSPETHFSEFNSQIADMKNSVADYGNANASCGGLFVQSHIGFDFEGNWIHLDMAKVVYNNERATGYGVALLGSLFGHLTSNPLLQSVSPKSPVKGDV